MNYKTDENIRKRIKDLVKSTGLTTKEFAKKIGMTPESIGKTLNGKQNLSDNLLNKLSDVFQVPKAYILCKDIYAGKPVLTLDVDRGIKIQQVVNLLKSFGYEFKETISFIYSVDESISYFKINENTYVNMDDNSDIITGENLIQKIQACDKNSVKNISHTMTVKAPGSNKKSYMNIFVFESIMYNFVEVIKNFGQAAFSKTYYENLFEYKCTNSVAYEAALYEMKD